MSEPESNTRGQERGPGNTRPRAHRRSGDWHANQPSAETGEYRSLPQVQREIRIESARMQHAFKRHFARVNKAMHYATGDLPNIVLALTRRFQAAEANAFAAQVIDDVDQLLEDARRTAEQDAERMAARCEEAGLDADSTQYGGFMVVDAMVSSRSANQLVEVMLKTDSLMRYADTLWIAGLEDNRVHAGTVRSFERRMHRLCNRLIELAIRGRRAIYQGDLKTYLEAGQHRATDDEVDAAPEVDFQLNPEELEELQKLDAERAGAVQPEETAGEEQAEGQELAAAG